MDDTVHVLVVDDHPLIRLAVTHLLQETELPFCVQAVSCHQEATASLRVREYDVAIVDVYLSDGSGLELIRHQRTQHRRTKWLVLSVFAEPFHQMRARIAGADGFLSKRAIESELLEAIQALLRDSDYPPGFRELHTNQCGEEDELSALSEREMTVFRLIAEGKSVEQIANSLARSRKTINALRDRIRSKLELSTSAELTRFATCWYVSQSVNPLNSPPNFLRRRNTEVDAPED